MCARVVVVTEDCSPRVVKVQKYNTMSQEEANALKQLRHPNIIALYNAFTSHKTLPNGKKVKLHLAEMEPRCSVSNWG